MYGGIMFFGVQIVGGILGVHIYTLFVQVALGALFYLLCSIIYFCVAKNEIVMGVLNVIRNKYYARLMRKYNRLD
jgi:ABC-type Co2+ transport system permease subunit